MHELNTSQTNGSRLNGEHVSSVGPVAPKAAAPPGAGTEEIERAVARSRAAAQHWRLQPLDTRIAAPKRAAKEMLRRRAEAIALANREMGKLEAEGLFNETLGPL